MDLFTKAPEAEAELRPEQRVEVKERQIWLHIRKHLGQIRAVGEKKNGMGCLLKGSVFQYWLLRIGRNLAGGVLDGIPEILSF